MADKNYVITLNVDASGAVSNLGEVEQQIADTSDKTLSLKQQLVALQKEMQNLDPSDAKFQELSNQAGELKDRIVDTAEAIKNNAGNAFEGLSNNAQTLGSRLLSMDFSGVGASAKAMAGNVKNINFKLVNEEIGGMIKGFGALGKALLANPIFLIGAAVAAIIMNFQELKGLIALTYQDETKALETATANVSAQKEKLDAISAQENTLRLQGKSEREILQMKIMQTGEVINATKQQIEQQKIVLQSQIAAEERSKSIVKGILQFVSIPLQFLAAQIDLIGEGLKKIGVVSESFGLRDKLNSGIDSLADMVFSPDDVRTKGEATLKELDNQLKGLENARDSHRIALQNMDKKAADDRKAAREKEAEEKRAAAEKEFAEMQAAKKDEYKLLPDAEKRLNKKVEAEKKATAELVGLAKSTTGLLLTEEQKRTAAEREEQNKRKENAKAAALVAVQNASDALGAIMALNDAFSGNSEREREKAFKRNKAFSIAQALINTYQAVNQQLANPIDSLTGANFVKAGIALALGIANVAKIAKTKYEGGGPPPSTGGGGMGGMGGGNVGGSSAPTPSFNPIDFSILGQRPNQANQSFVLAGQVSNAQDANSKIKDLSRL